MININLLFFYSSLILLFFLLTKTVVVTVETKPISVTEEETMEEKAEETQDQ